ncbi:Uncharacterised protein [Mycobacteroides abscessus subsp. abscessus]|nr:Uncharacterised protein [Mycobacteroides abscessus subsp. abscessus]
MKVHIGRRETRGIALRRAAQLHLDERREVGQQRLRCPPLGDACRRSSLDDAAGVDDMTALLGGDGHHQRSAFGIEPQPAFSFQPQECLAYGGAAAPHARGDLPFAQQFAARNVTVEDALLDGAVGLFTRGDGHRTNHRHNMYLSSPPVAPTSRKSHLTGCSASRRRLPPGRRHLRLQTVEVARTAGPERLGELRGVSGRIVRLGRHAQVVAVKAPRRVK